jgi:hypothetical protein
MTKVCKSCNKSGQSKMFAKGAFGICNRCYKIKWEKENPIKLRSQRLYGSASKRAKFFNWPSVDFNTEWIYEKIMNGYCEATGIPFDLTSEIAGSHTKNPWVPSIDRIDSAKPYIKSNVQIVVYMYNVCKSEFSHQDVLKFCKYLYKKEVEIGI